MALTIVPIEERSGMLERVESFPDQVTEAYALGKDLVLPSSYQNIHNIMVIGMGGSGIVGDFLRVLLRKSSIPVYVNKHSQPLGFVNESTLLLAVTYSGKTQETLDALKICTSVGAKIICLTSGNELKAMCDKKRVPCITIPENGHSRASLGYLLVPLLCMLRNASILEQESFDIRETIRVLNKIKSECSPTLPLQSNPVRSLAFDLVDRLPIIYGEHNFTDVAAVRWKQQLNENSKVNCYYDNFPELLHNEIEAWDGRGQCENYALILLRDAIYEREVDLQGKIRATKHIVQQRGSRVYEFWGHGRSELSRLLSLSYLGDYTSVYLAMAKGVDPSVVHNIEFIKESNLVKERATDEQ